VDVRPGGGGQQRVTTATRTPAAHNQYRAGAGSASDTLHSSASAPVPTRYSPDAAPGRRDVPVGPGVLRDEQHPQADVAAGEERGLCADRFAGGGGHAYDGQHAGELGHDEYERQVEEQLEPGGAALLIGLQAN
jgi:hypothetical protein